MLSTAILEVIGGLEVITWQACHPALEDFSFVCLPSCLSVAVANECGYYCMVLSCEVCKLSSCAVSTVVLQLQLGAGSQLRICVIQVGFSCCIQ